MQTTLSQPAERIRALEARVKGEAQRTSFTVLSGPALTPGVTLLIGWEHGHRR